MFFVCKDHILCAGGGTGGEDGSETGVKLL